MLRFMHQGIVQRVPNGHMIKHVIPKIVKDAIQLQLDMLQASLSKGRFGYGMKFTMSWNIVFAYNLRLAATLLASLQ